MESDESINGKCSRILEELYTKDNLNFNSISNLLSEFRILTREKNLKPELLDSKCIQILVDNSSKNHTEAQKCLSNLILNYAQFREQITEPYIRCVENRFQTVLNDKSSSYSNLESKQLYEILYYDLRIVFLLSALCSSSRVNIRDRILVPLLRITEREAEKYSQDNNLLIIESLKTLFNLTLDECLNESLAGDVIKKLFIVVHNSDKSNNQDPETKDQLLVNLIHLLTNMPKEIYLKLSDEDVNRILNHLNEQLEKYSKSSCKDTVLPVLNVCANICKYNDEVRKRWCSEIIESTNEFEKRPEEYDTLRGRLVKLMTSVDVHLKDIAADFMHALCGGDTEKLITYSGFGNSAAFLSSRGMLGEIGHKNSLERTSANEEYEEIRAKIDPITGRIETPKRNPMEDMTEEQKEYHAHELANAITKLSNLGIVKPINFKPGLGTTKDIHPGASGDEAE